MTLKEAGMLKEIKLEDMKNVYPNVVLDPLTPNYYLHAVERSKPENALMNWTCLYCSHLNSTMDNALVSCRKCGENGITENGVLKTQGGLKGNEYLAREVDEFTRKANYYSL